MHRCRNTRDPHQALQLADVRRHLAQEGCLVRLVRVRHNLTQHAEAFIDAIAPPLLCSHMARNAGFLPISQRARHSAVRAGAAIAPAPVALSASCYVAHTSITHSSTQARPLRSSPRAGGRLVSRRLALRSASSLPLRLESEPATPVSSLKARSSLSGRCGGLTPFPLGRKPNPRFRARCCRVFHRCRGRREVVLMLVWCNHTVHHAYHTRQ